MKLTDEQEAAIAKLQAKAKEYSDAADLCVGAYNKYKASSERANQISFEYHTIQAEVLQILAGQKVASNATDA